MAVEWDENEALIAVFDSPATAVRASDRVRRVVHDPGRVRVGDLSDADLALRAEMQADAEDSWASAQAGVIYPGEAAKGLALLLPACTLIGALVLLPLGFIPVGDVALWVRLLIAAAVGALMGSTVALVAAPALAARRPDDPMASERGVVVRVDAVGSDVVDALTACDPLRLDRVMAADGSRIESIVVRRPTDAATVVRNVRERARDPHGDADVQSTPITNRTVQDRGSEEPRP